jgi:hypothetical protein
VDRSWDEPGLEVERIIRRVVTGASRSAVAVS